MENIVLKKSLSALIFKWWGSVGEARTFVNEVKKINIEVLRAAVEFLAA